MNPKLPYGNYVHVVLTAHAERLPDSIAISYRGEQISYSALDDRVNQLANALLSEGVSAGMHVASLLSDALPIATLYLAEARIGAVIAALNPYWDENVLLGVIENSRIDVLIFDQGNAQVIAKLRDRFPDIKLIMSMGCSVDDTVCLDEKAAAATTDAPEIGAAGDDPLAFFYTSGSTGLPKAVVHTHNSCIAISRASMELPYDRNSVWGTGPIIWGVGFPSTLGAAFFVGMRVALEDDFGPKNFLEVVQREKVTHCALLPSQCLDLLNNYPHEKYDLDSLRMVIMGSEPMLPSLLKRLQARCPNMGLYAYYGQTEAPYACLGRLDDGSQDLDVAGLPRITGAARVLDPAGNRVVGQVGEITLRGPQLFTEYYGHPEKTAQTLVNGWFHTGDLGVQDENGFVKVLGRREEAIFRDNHFVRPAEIEDVALGIDGIGEAGAVGVPAGRENQKILLAVSPAPGYSIDEAQVVKQLSQRLPEYAQVDKLVIADELPHGNDASGGKGKLQRRVILERYGDLLMAGRET